MLGVPPGATGPEVQAAWRRLAKEHHPDRLQHLLPDERAAAAEKLREINAAYEALKQEPPVEERPAGAPVATTAPVTAPAPGPAPRRRRRRWPIGVALLAVGGVVAAVVAAGTGGGGGGDDDRRGTVGTAVAEPIAYGEERAARLAGDRDVKVLPFTGTAGDTISLVLTREAPERPVGVGLLGPDGRRLASWEGADLPPGERTTELGPVSLPATGSYRIVAANLSDRAVSVRVRLVKLAG